MSDENRKMVTQSELARYVSVSYVTIYRYIKAGIFDNCFTPTGKRIYLDCALKAYHAKQRTRPKHMPKHKELHAAQLEEDFAKQTKEAEKELEEAIYNTDSEAELLKLLINVEDPYTRTRITTQFWDGKAKRLKFLEAEGELIPLDDAKRAVDAVLVPFNKDLDDLPVQFKGHYPEVPQEGIEWLFSQIDAIKRKSAVRWENLEQE